MHKIGIIGLGPMGQRHIRAANAIDSVHIVGIVDLHHDVIEKTISENHLPSDIGYTSHLDMLQQAQPEIVVIATNGPSHFPIFLDLVQAGVKKILCEKPIAVSLAEAYDMLKISKEYNVQFLVNHPRRWCSDYLDLRNKLAEGIIGKVESFTFSMGGGQMACNGTHMIDLASFLINQPVDSVIGYLNDEDVQNPRGAQFKDPGGYALLHFKDQTRMYFEMTDDLGIPPILIINGKYGRIVIDEVNRYYTIAARSDQDRDLPVTRYGTPLSKTEKVEYRNLDIIKLSESAIRYLIDNTLPMDPEQSIQAIEAIIAIHYSNELNHQPVSLPLLNNEIIERKFSFT